MYSLVSKPMFIIGDNIEWNIKGWSLWTASYYGPNLVSLCSKNFYSHSSLDLWSIGYMVSSKLPKFFGNSLFIYFTASS